MAYKIFENGFPLQASELNTFLMQQSVIVFADVSARTAGIPEPVEGMVTYLQDDNQLYKWTGSDWENITAPNPITTQGDLIIGDSGGLSSRLGIGAADTVLTSNGTTATWVAPGGSGNYTLITSGTLAAEALSITSIPQDYDDLILECSFDDATQLRINDISTASYNLTEMRTNASTLTNANASSWNLSGGIYHRVELWDYTRSGKFLAGEAWYKGSSRIGKYLLGSSADFDPITKITTLATQTGTFALYGKSFV